MMITSYDEKNVDIVIDEIEKLYPGLIKHRGKVLNYIGMTFNFEKAGQDLSKSCLKIVRRL